MIAQKVASRSL